MGKEIAEAKERLMTALPYFRKAVADAKKKGRVQLGILATNPDGSGDIEMRFDCDEFFADIETALGAPAQTKDDDMEADALKFLNTHRIKTPNVKLRGE